jgi:hypothetical protein
MMNRELTNLECLLILAVLAAGVAVVLGFVK